MSRFNFTTNFITNDNGYSLVNRFAEILPNTKEFDCLVAYLYFNGLKLISKHLDHVERTRILVGLGIDDQIKDFYIKEKNFTSNANDNNDQVYISDFDLRCEYEKHIIQQVENSDDDENTERAILKFKDLISSGKLQIRVYKTRNLHAKVYIMKYRDGHDPGIVITGSSNLTLAGLQENLEFNVQLRDPRDYEYARNRFEELWKFGVDISELTVNTINKTHLSSEISPYEIYLKFLYEYFKEELEFDESSLKSDLGDKFLDFEYQRQAVISALKIIKDHGGVILSDVVGLGKTYIAARIAKQLDGNHLVIAPPALIDENNPGSWPRVFRDLKINNVEYVSIGKLINFDFEDFEYENVFIDESHRFRNENTKSHDKLMDICHGKKVVLVSATPFNNYPKDLLAQIKLFQNTKNSTIPGILNLEKFFRDLDDKLLKVGDYRKKEVSKEISREIRNKVLRHIMIRRTRSEILRFYKEDLEKKHIKFPEIKDPIIAYYSLNQSEEEIFDKTIELIKKFKYTRYKPLTYLKAPINDLQKASQENMAFFMKTLLVKRFDSSIYAFKKTLDRFEKSYSLFKQNFEQGLVYLSKKSNYELVQVLAEDDDIKLFKLLEEGKVDVYSSDEFKETLFEDLKSDLNIITEVKNLWASVNSDPKLEKLIELLKNELSYKKVIIFTESKETSEYLAKEIQKTLNESVLTFNGSITSKEARQKVVDNFDANAKDKKDDYRILVTTEVLAEGVNLHRSNIIVNYDIPWNPTKVIQRVGRLNRVGTKFDYIYIYNFFPTARAEDEINLKELAINKFNMFIELLGTDSKLLTETDEVKSHVLFNTLNSRNLFTQDDDPTETELFYLKEIEEIKNNNPTLFDKIKYLPKKIRSCKNSLLLQNSLVSYFKKGNIDKFILFSPDLDSPKEIDFFDAVKYIKSLPDEKALELPNNFYDYLNKNKQFFDSLISTIYDSKDDTLLRGNPLKLYKRLKIVLSSPDLSSIQRNYLRLVIDALKETSLHKKRLQNALKEIGDSYEGYYIYNVLTKYFGEKMLKEKIEATRNNPEAKKLIILSMYFS